MAVIKVGIIGFGLSGRVFHAPFLSRHPGFEVTHVLSTRPDEVAKLLPAAAVVNSIEKIVKNTEVDLVINCAPNAYHYSYTKLALENQKHVVVEKPFVNKSEEGLELIALAKKQNRVLTVFQSRRWDSDFLTLRSLIKENTFGDVMTFESRYDRFRPNNKLERWKEQALEGSGIWFDLGPHLVDQALVLFGKPDDLTADIQIQRPGALAPDYFHVVMKYGSKRVILHGSSYFDGTPRFLVHGTKGHWIKFGMDSQEEALKGRINWDTLGIVEAHPSDRLTVYSDDGPKNQRINYLRGNYMGFYESLHSCLNSPTASLPVDPKSALEVIEILELAQKKALASSS